MGINLSEFEKRVDELIENFNAEDFDKWLEEKRRREAENKVFDEIEKREASDKERILQLLFNLYDLLAGFEYYPHHGDSVTRARGDIMDEIRRRTKAVSSPFDEPNPEQ